MFRLPFVRPKGSLSVLLLFSLIVAAAFLLYVQPAQSAQITLAWDPSSDAAVTGYKLYWGTQSQQYALLADVGNSTTETVADLQPGTTYYFVATAYDGAGDESVYSNEVTYTAATQAYTIAALAGTGGTITPAGSFSISAGTDQPFTISANSGYSISDVTVDGASVGAASSYTFTGVAGNHTISATFVADTYTLSVTKSGTGAGTVTTNPGGTTFTPGTTVALTAAPATGSTFTGWSGACTGTSFTCVVAVTSNMTVTASFTATTYAITASSGSGGSISPIGTTSVVKGSSKSYLITPAVGYAISGVKVDGVSKGKLSSYTFNSVTANHKIQATFSRTKLR